MTAGFQSRLDEKRGSRHAPWTTGAIQSWISLSAAKGVIALVRGLEGEKAFSITNEQRE